MRWAVRIIGVGVAGLALAGWASGAWGADPVSMGLDWKIKGTHSPYFVAKKKGYYQAEGIEVSIHEGAGSVTAVKLVGSDKYGFASADFGTLAKGVIRGIPVKAVFAIKQTSPMCIIALPESGIKTLADLKGKTLAISTGDSTSQILPVLLAKNQIPQESIRIVTTAAAGKVAALLEGKVDAMTGYTSNQLQIIRARLKPQGKEPIAIRYSDYGVNLLANGVITQEKMVEKNPGLIRRFLRATKKGWEDATGDRKGAIDILLGYYPEEEKQRFIFSGQLDEVILLMDSLRTRGKPMGWMAHEDWVETQSFLRQYGDIEKEVPVEGFYTNAFIP